MMMNKMHYIVFSLLLMGCFGSLGAKVTLPAVFSNNMVLQQKSNVPIWGQGVSGQTIKVVGSWMPQDTVKSTIDASGQWKVLLPTAKAGGPYTLTVIGSSTVKLINVLLGEVWLCSGQSNMEWRAEIGIKDKEREIEAAEYPNIRFFDVANRGANYPQNNCEGEWIACTPETMPKHSAVAYFFARELQRKMNVPIGLMTADWGGTPAEVWLPRESVEDNLLLNANKPTQEFAWWPIKSGVLYNQMIHPIIEYGIAGAIWYQGESNQERYSAYHLLMKTLIEQWRAKNGREFPFYFVQIAPYTYKSKHNTVALLREQQEMTWKEVPRTGMVVVNDLVHNIHDIHPQDKQNVGLRLANFALAEQYKFPIAGYKSPTFKAVEREGNRMAVLLDNALKGIQCKGKRIEGLVVTDNEGKTLSVAATIEKGQLLITVPKLPQTTIIISYCFDDATVGNLFSVEGELPVAPFRTFEMSTVKVAKNEIADIVPDAFMPIAIQNQQLNGYLGMRMKQNKEERLLKIDEAMLVESYTKRPGNHPWAGEHIGKYLETAANVWLNSRDERIKKQMDRMAIQLIESQLGDGYLGTYPQEDYWKGWDVWSHKYNLYGLLAYYKATDYKPALIACQKMGDLLCATFGKEPGKKDIIQAGTHVGMAATSVLDPMIELYKITGNKHYLNFCYYLLEAWEQENGPKIISGLLTTGKVNKVANGKAYEMLSNLVGLIKFYRLTGDKKLLKPVEIAWQDIVLTKCYITGTTSAIEYFQEGERLLSTRDDNIGEGCVTTTWLQLNQNLFEATGELKYFDEVERTIYNHLLGAENPLTGGVSYFTPTQGEKPYICEVACCTSSIPRGIAMIPLATFGNINNTPTLMLYEAGQYKIHYTDRNQKVKEASLIVETDFPEADGMTVTVNVPQEAAFPLGFRVPGWCNSFVAKVGNEVYKGKINECVTIHRTWKSGEKIVISFETPIELIAGGNSYPRHLALKKGPQVLAFESSLNHGEDCHWVRTGRVEQIKTIDPTNHAALLPQPWIGKQAYRVSIDGKNSITVVPFAEAGQTGGSVHVWMPLINSSFNFNNEIKP